jgi:glycine/D-amino acid oxidase-like deaminating enzyme
MPDRIVVAGAGIVGASIGYHLAKRGVRVTILDAVAPGAGATGKSMGWINATFSKLPRAYFDLNCAGIDAWRRLQRDLGAALNVQWGGSVAWAGDALEAEELRTNVRRHREWGYQVTMVNCDEFRRLLPNIHPGDIAAACYSEPEGAVNPREATNILLERARERGADVRFPCEVTSPDLYGTFVLACGTGSPKLAAVAGVNVPLKDSPGVLLHTVPAPRLIDRVVCAPGIHFKQGADGRIVAAGPIVAGPGTAITEAAVEEADEVRRSLEKYLPQVRDIPTDHVTLGHRVMPLDEYPIIGFAAARPNLYVAATHSGVTLAPLIGELAAREILDGAAEEILKPYRPTRFG